VSELRAGIARLEAEMRVAQDLAENQRVSKGVELARVVADRDAALEQSRRLTGELTELARNNAAGHAVGRCRFTQVHPRLAPG
jgi:hypothetical protein